jgi:hypothetical protein
MFGFIKKLFGGNTQATTDDSVKCPFKIESQPKTEVKETVSPVSEKAPEAAVKSVAKPAAKKTAPKKKAAPSKAPKQTSKPKKSKTK